jgi:hypothetical protein
MGGLFIIGIGGRFQDGLSQERMEGTLSPLDDDYGHLRPVGNLICDIANQQIPEERLIRRSDHDQITITFFRVLQDRVQDAGGFNDFAGDMWIIDPFQCVIKNLI